jgi:DtxR family Mn-dependent transcriptional regulator
MNPSELSESLEDYLLAISELESMNIPVHSGKVAERVGVSTASVTHAFRALSQRELIDYKPYQAVSLTASGVRTAAQITHRKRTLNKFFREVLELDEDEAAQNAHRMEHVITERAVNRLSELIERLSGE